MSSVPVINQWALGFMVFALFLGAGNIIFPPAAGLASGAQVLWAALGFLVTAVGLPWLGLLAVARAGGGLSRLIQPLGPGAGFLISALIYLAIGPFFAMPRTALVSFEMALAPLCGDTSVARLIYGACYFALVFWFGLHRGRLIDTVGRWMTPILLLGLLVLGLAAWFIPAGSVSTAVNAPYQEHPFMRGIVEGYLTMDLLGALVFGVVLSTAIREAGIDDPYRVLCYSARAGLIAAVGLIAVYVSFFYLGATSAALVPEGSNGVQILVAFSQHTLGNLGYVILAVVIVLACLTTAVGLVVACSEFFSQRFSVSYPKMVLLFTVFSGVVANLGLTSLIQVSVPILVTLYPVAIALVLLTLLQSCWHYSTRVFTPVLGITLLFGCFDGAVAAGWATHLPVWVMRLPLASQGLAWLLPALIGFGVAVCWDHVASTRGR